MSRSRDAKIVAFAITLGLGFFASHAIAQTGTAHVGVTVVEKTGSAGVAGLGSGDFSLTDSGRERKIEAVHQTSAGNGDLLPAEKDGWQMNRRLGANGPQVSILVLDAVHSDLADQARVRDQLIRALALAADNNQRIELLLLSNDG